MSDDGKKDQPGFQEDPNEDFDTQDLDSGNLDSGASFPDEEYLDEEYPEEEFSSEEFDEWEDEFDDFDSPDQTMQDAGKPKKKKNSNNLIITIAVLIGIVVFAYNMAFKPGEKAAQQERAFRSSLTMQGVSDNPAKVGLQGREAAEEEQQEQKQALAQDIENSAEPSILGRFIGEENSQASEETMPEAREQSAPTKMLEPVETPVDIDNLRAQSDVAQNLEFSSGTLTPLPEAQREQSAQQEGDLRPPPGEDTQDRFTQNQTSEQAQQAAQNDNAAQALITQAMERQRQARPDTRPDVPDTIDARTENQGQQAQIVQESPNNSVPDQDLENMESNLAALTERLISTEERVGRILLVQDRQLKEIRNITENISERLDSLNRDIGNLQSQVASQESRPVRQESRQEQSAPRSSGQQAAQTTTRTTETAPEKPAQKPQTARRVETRASVSRPSVSRPAARAKEWELRAAQPGRVWVAEKGKDDIQSLEIGDTLSGVGRITAITFANGRWLVQGTQGTLRQ